MISRNCHGSRPLSMTSRARSCGRPVRMIQADSSDAPITITTTTAVRSMASTKNPPIRRGRRGPKNSSTTTSEISAPSTAASVSVTNPP